MDDSESTLRMVRSLAPAQSDSDWRSFIADGRQQLADPFSEARLQTLGRLSTAILRHPSLRADSPCVALAFWLRPGNLRRLHETAMSRHLHRSDTLARPTGLVFHIAPANVDTMFMYSWALSFLCGNTNLVRLPQDRSGVMDGLVECLNDTMETDVELRRANQFVTYGHDDEVTGCVSARCSLRVVWGGDETVSRIRAIPLNPHAAERCFPTKYSRSLIRTEAYLDARQETRESIAESFYGDLFSFDQMACSSPHQVLWLGDLNGEYETAIAAFDAALSAEIERRKEPLSVSLAVRRRNYAFEMAAENHARFDPGTIGFSALQTIDDTPLRPDCGGGLYAHACIQSSQGLAAIATEADQTVSHFGFTASDLADIGQILGDCGVDRIVPIGEALAFEPTWDGFDLIGDFLRFVTVRESRPAHDIGSRPRSSAAATV